MKRKKKVKKGASNNASKTTLINHAAKYLGRLAKKPHHIVVREAFSGYSYELINEFIDQMLPPPISGQNKFFNIKSSDKVSLWIWDVSVEELLNKFDRFLNLQVWL